MPARRISFTLGADLTTTLTGTATGSHPNPGGGPDEVDHLTLTWNIPVHVAAGAHPTMSFPGATRHLVTVISSRDSPDQTVDPGNLLFTTIATRAFPLRKRSAACP